MSITIKDRGSFVKMEAFLSGIMKRSYLKNAEKYASLVTLDLVDHTPVVTGTTAESWYYDITQYHDGLAIEWGNINTTEDGIPIVVFIRYGHANPDGTHTTPNDFVTPVIDRWFDVIADDVWKEVVEL